MGEPFHIQFPTDLSEVTTSVGSGQTIAQSAGAGLGGTTGGCTITINNTNNVFWKKTFTAISTSDFVVRLYVDFSSLSSSSGNTFDLLWITRAGASETVKSFLRYNNNSGTIRLQHFVLDDASSSSSENVNWDSSDYIQIHLQKATNGTGANDGFSKLYFGDTLKSTLSNIDLYDHFDFDRFHFGGITGLDSGTTGSIKVDEIKSNDTGTLIGSTNASPTVTDISNQTGVFGTQLSVTCTIADTDSDIARCDVSTDGSCLITLTASGAATVTNNGGTAPYVTGTHADVVATLGNNIKFDRAESHPTRSATETITVLVTDDNSATGSDTFDITWGIATGVGTKALKLTGTATQINAALSAGLEWTPTTDFTGTTTVSMYSKTSTPLDDTDSFNIEVNEEPLAVIELGKTQLVFKKEPKLYLTETLKSLLPGEITKVKIRDDNPGSVRRSGEYGYTTN